MIDLFHGPDAFVKKLSATFTTSSEVAGPNDHDMTGFIGQYVHGNEPSHHMAYLFALAGPARSHPGACAADSHHAL
jgi:putative alpha-1,2-mannosidase